MKNAALRNLPRHGDSLGNADQVVVLSVAPAEDQRRLRSIFSRTRWRLIEATTIDSALKQLQQTAAGIVVCDAKLPDGTWKDLRRRVAGFRTRPLVVVSGWHASDSLWAEALNEGAYDVLSKPFDKAEVIRILSLAWLQWRDSLRSTVHRPVAPAQRGEFCRTMAAHAAG
jgi:DNA-binding NtrC family response regulator